MAGRASAWPLVAKQVTSLWRALPGYVTPTPGGGGGSGIGVYYATEIGDVGRRDRRYCVVGWSDPDAPGPAGASTQKLWQQGGAPAARHRAEDGSITCLVSVAVGDAPAHAASTTVDAAFALADDLDGLLRVSPGPNLGLVGTGAGQVPALVAWISGVPQVRPMADEGARCELTVDISFLARI